MTFFKKYTILSLVLLGSLILLAPIDKAMADHEFRCCQRFDNDIWTNPCPEFSGMTEAAAEIRCEQLCDIQNCRSYQVLPKEHVVTPVLQKFGCIKTKKYQSYNDSLPCQNITAVNQAEAQPGCAAFCGLTEVYDGSETCDLRTVPCFVKPEKPSPLAGTSLGELQDSAFSSLNRAGLSKPADLIKRVINLLMAFIGSITLVLYVFAGVLFLTASGATDRVEKAKKIMVWTTLGVAVMLFSYMLVSFLFNIIPT